MYRSIITFTIIDNILQTIPSRAIFPIFGGITRFYCPIYSCSISVFMSGLEILIFLKNPSPKSSKVNFNKFLFGKY